MGLSRDEAEEITAGLGQIHAGGWRVTASLIRIGVPRALGLSDEQWISERLGGAVKLSSNERREAVIELREEGMTQRQVAAALGIAQSTVVNDQNRSAPDRKPSSPAASDQNRSKPTPDRPGATRFSKNIQKVSASIAEKCSTLTDDEIAEALGAAEFLYKLLRGETIIRESKQGMGQ